MCKHLKQSQIFNLHLICSCVSKYQNERVGIPLPGLNPSHFDVCFKHGLDILSFSVVIHKSRVLKFTRGEVCIIDVGYIVNHCCFMLTIGMIWYIMSHKSCVVIVVKSL